MLRTPPRRRKRSSPMQNPIKRSKVLSETHEEIDNLEENESSLNNASRVKENGVEKHCLNDNTIQQAPEQSSQTKETSVNTNNADDSEIQLSQDKDSIDQGGTFISDEQTSQKTTPRTTKRGKGRPKENITQKMLLESINDQDSPIMKTLISALVSQIRGAIKDELKSQEKNFEILTQQIDSLKTELKEKNGYISQLETRIDDLEQYSRRNCLVISGIPETENESTDDIILDLVNKQLNTSLEAREIDRSHRVPGGPPRINADKPRNIIVKFTSYNARKGVFEKKSNLKNARNRIFINENNAVRCTSKRENSLKQGK